MLKKKPNNVIMWVNTALKKYLERVTKKKTYCCFNSKLGRIIVEEGRKQLKNLDWGSAKNPNCRGFSPEEFQKIDFSRIDLTEFTDDLQNQINTNNIQNLSDRMQEKIQMMQGY